MNSKINSLEEDLRYLKLHKTCELINESDVSVEVLNFIELMCSKEKQEKHKSAANAVVKVANFPHLKTIEDFDYEFQPSINKDRIDELCTMDFMEKNENIVFIGTPGVGKTHLATSIGLIAANKRISTYFIKCHKLLQNLKIAYEENRLEERLKHYRKYKLLIIDEVGFLPISEIESKILFQLIDMRYENKSTIFTSNLTLDKWNTIFNDMNISNAIIDRIVHHSNLFNINGSSYRLKDKLEETANS